MQISIEKRYDNYLNTLRLCSSEVNKHNGEYFLYVLFELLSIDVYTCFSEANLDVLADADFIHPDEERMSIEIRDLFQKNEKVWFEIHEPELIKENDEWKRVNMLADRILGSRGIYL